MLVKSLRKLYEHCLALSAHKRASWALGFVSFIESSFFPIPPDLMLIPMIMAERRKAWLYALICTLASVAGGLFGYFIGYALWDSLGQPVIALYHGQAAFDKFTTFYDVWGGWIVLAAAISFLPFKVATIASGVAGLALLPFFFASLAGRGIRFFAVAALMYYYGPQMRKLIERYFNILSMAFVGLLLLGFILLGAAG